MYRLCVFVERVELLERMYLQVEEEGGQHSRQTWPLPGTQMKQEQTQNLHRGGNFLPFQWPVLAGTSMMQPPSPKIHTAKQKLH